MYRRRFTIIPGIPFNYKAKIANEVYGEVNPSESINRFNITETIEPKENSNDNKEINVKHNNNPLSGNSNKSDSSFLFFDTQDSVVRIKKNIETSNVNNDVYDQVPVVMNNNSFLRSKRINETSTVDKHCFNLCTFGALLGYI